MNKELPLNVLTLSLVVSFKFQLNISILLSHTKNTLSELNVLCFTCLLPTLSSHQSYPTCSRLDDHKFQALNPIYTFVWVVIYLHFNFSETTEGENCHPQRVDVF